VPHPQRLTIITAPGARIRLGEDTSWSTGTPAAAKNVGLTDMYGAVGCASPG
jgi:hypothetical protein